MAILARAACKSLGAPTGFGLARDNRAGSLQRVRFDDKNAFRVRDAHPSKTATDGAASVVVAQALFSCFLADTKIGSAPSCKAIENATRAGIDLSYSKPMIALPANHAMPKPVSNTPKAVLRFSEGTTPASTA